MCGSIQITFPGGEGYLIAYTTVKGLQQGTGQRLTIRSARQFERRRPELLDFYKQAQDFELG